MLSKTYVILYFLILVSVKKRNHTALSTIPLFEIYAGLQLNFQKSNQYFKINIYYIITLQI